jgi:phosphatidylserine/phosphatidylglycerophosphate/cardiolipin synthase-like enzyme
MSIQLMMGPAPLGGADLRSTICDFIDAAKKKLEVAVQELEDEQIAKALIAAKQRGVEVKVVLEADYLRATKAMPDPWVPAAAGYNEGNRAVHDALLRACAWVRSDFNPNIFHQKFIVRDGTAVLTGSTNFTPTGVEKNLNHVLIIEDAKIAKVFHSEFLEISRGQFGRRSMSGDDTPVEKVVAGVRVKVAFAPDHAPEMEIIKQMLKARKKIEFAMFTFSQSSGIDDTMIALRQHTPPVPITGILDRRQANQSWAATAGLKKAKVALHTIKRGTPVGKLHHKLMVIDEKVVIAGSFNYTGPANRLNDENIVVLGKMDAKGDDLKRQRAIAKVASKEIARIIETYGTPL